MAEITASMVKELREMTGLGMMECKKALVESNGDMKAAEDQLRIKSGAKATKAAGRITSEGVIGAYITADGQNGALVEVNCETDFVAKNEDIINFAKDLAELITIKKLTVIKMLGESLSSGETVEARRKALIMELLGGEALPSGETVEATHKVLVMKLGENISIRRYERHTTHGQLASYLHGTKIGVMVDYSGGDGSLGKDLAMHIAATRPMCVSKDQVPADILDHERQIFTAQAAESGKSEDIIEKMVDGRVAKYLAEVTLLSQPFVKDPEKTVEQLLVEKNAKVNSFTMFAVGEGIERKVENFAEEVKAQIEQKK